MFVTRSLRTLFLWFLFVSLEATAVFAQGIPWAAVPPDPNELVTGPAKILTNPQERSAALELIDRARQNYTFYGPHAPAFTLKVSFVSTGTSQYEGQGLMEETWVGRSERWSARIGSAETLRIIYQNQFWSDNPSAPIPMRVHMVRDAILWPVQNLSSRALMRAAAATLNGKALMCVLTAGSMANVDQPRHWVEREYCMEPQTGNLILWSEAPGHYVVYDYTVATEFKGHFVANDISVYEAGSRVVQIHIDGIEDASGVNPESLKPSPELMAKGPSFGLSGPERFPVMVPAPNGIKPTVIQPVIVHATLDHSGHVIESETLQNSNPELASKAIETVRGSKLGFGGPQRERGAGGPQREVFVNVEFLTGPQQVASAQ
jgi:hypothetical protein